MLCAIPQRDKRKVAAWDQQKSDGPFSSPLCIAETTLKKGTMKVHHFAHKPPILCEYGRGETEQHRECKLTIYEGLRRHGRFRDVEIERSMGTVRPDVSGLMDGIPFAIEVQISALTTDQIVYRTSEYAKKGRSVSLADSFIPWHRAVEWRSRRLVIPESRLLIDTQRIWW
jgi:competence protein CoiA